MCSLQCIFTSIVRNNMNYGGRMEVRAGYKYEIGYVQLQSLPTSIVQY